MLEDLTKKQKIVVGFLVVFIVLGVASAAFAREKPNDNGNSQHVDNWHGTGSDHQANNEPGDTAADRHGFNNDTAGNSGKNPRANANGG